MLINEEDYYINNEIDDWIINKMNGMLSFKRLLLPIGLLIPFFIYYYNNEYYIFFSLFVSSIIITWNFPSLTKIGYQKPIYFEDLEKEDLEEIHNENNYQKSFYLLNGFLFSLTLSLFIDYVLQNYKMSSSELLGIVGGLSSLYIKISRTLGRFILQLVFYQKKKKIILSCLNI